MPERRFTAESARAARVAVGPIRSPLRCQQAVVVQVAVRSLVEDVVPETALVGEPEGLDQATGGVVGLEDAGSDSVDGHIVEERGLLGGGNTRLRVLDDHVLYRENRQSASGSSENRRFS